MTNDDASRPVGDGGPDGTLFESFPDPLLAYSCEGRPGASEGGADGSDSSPVVSRVNAAFEATFGVAAEGVAGTPLGEVGLAGTVVPAGGGAGTGSGTSDGVRGSDAADPDPRGGDTPDAADGDTTDARGAGARTAATAGSLLDRLREDAGTPVWLGYEADDATRYFRVRVVDDSTDGAGYLLFTEVTDLERRRRDLARTVTRLERLMSVARHDLRNPLEVAEIRLEAARDTGEAIHFEKVAGALDRIERIVRDVLAVGDGVEPSERVDLGSVAEAAWGTVDTADAELVVSAELPTVRGDADRLRGLFENLFRNAVEHGSTSSRPEADDPVEHGSTTPRSRAREDSVARSTTSSRAGPDDSVEHGDPAVTVRVEPTPDGFAVADDGPGVPEGARERVFEVGYSTREDGSGLGLSIVRQIAREHGWHVSLAKGRDPPADAEGGARFEFTGVEPVGSDPGEPDDRPDDTDGPTERSGSAGPN